MTFAKMETVRYLLWQRICVTCKSVLQVLHGTRISRTAVLTILARQRASLVQSRRMSEYGNGMARNLFFEFTHENRF